MLDAIEFTLAIIGGCNLLAFTWFMTRVADALD
jgi:hypothetical protein